MRWFSKLLATAVVALGCQVATAADFHVAPNGNDADPGTEAKPFATLERARKAVRQINRGMKEDIVVVLRGGTYRIDQTIVFEPEDSGTGGHNVIYRAQAGETPIISGGKPVTGWQPDEKGRWKAPAPVDDFRQLYVNGIRATRARGETPAGLEAGGRGRLHDHGGRHGRLEEPRRPGVLLRHAPGPTRAARCRASSAKATRRSSPCSSRTSPMPRPRKA